MADRCKEHQLGYADRSALAEYSINKGHEVLFSSATMIAKSASFWDCMIREALEIKLELRDMN